MGQRVSRPVREGEGERPETPKPGASPHLVRALAGDRPHTPKPQPRPTDKAKRGDEETR